MKTEVQILKDELAQCQKRLDVITETIADIRFKSDIINGVAWSLNDTTHKVIQTLLNRAEFAGDT